MSLALCCMLFGILLFLPETGTAPRFFSSKPPNPSYAVKGEDFTLAWSLTFDGGLRAVQVSKVTESGVLIDVIGRGNGTGKVEMTAKYEARFRGQAAHKRVELKILAVQLSDEATYQLNLVLSNAAIPFNRVKVIVNSPPSNIVTSSDQVVTAPTELTLNCSADGKPKPTITWTRVSDNATVSMPLKITRGKNEESYQCTAYNGVGNSLTKVIKITSQSPPMVTLVQKVFVGREQNVSLKCEAEGNPTPNISWSPCDVGNPLCNKQYLNISKVQSAHASYTCTARNYLGKDSATTIVLIGGKNISLRLSINGECDNHNSVWHALVKELPRVFANTTQNYSGAELINLSFTGNKFGSLIIDVVLKFTTEVAEHRTIFIIENAIVDGKLGELSRNVSSIIGIPHFPQTTITAPNCSTPESVFADSGNKIALIIGAILGIAAGVPFIIFIVWYVCKKCRNKAKFLVNTNDAQRRKGKGQNGNGEVAYPSTPMLPLSERPVMGKRQSKHTSSMYAQADQTRRTSNKGGAAQYAEMPRVKSGESLSKKSSSQSKDPRYEVELTDS